MTHHREGGGKSAFRLLQEEISFRSKSDSLRDRYFNAPNLILGALLLIGTYSLFDLSARAHAWWMALVVIFLQTVAVLIFALTKKYDWLTARLVMGTYILFYSYLLFFGHVELQYPMYWSISFGLFCFVTLGAAEGIVWTLAYMVLSSGAIYIDYDKGNPLLSASTLALYTINFFSIILMALSLEYSSRLSTERAKRQSLELEEANVRYDVILNSVGDGLVATDEKGIVDFVNSRALELLKTTRDDLLGQPFTAVIFEKDKNGELIPHKDRLLTKVLESGEQASHSYISNDGTYLVRSDDSSFPAGISINPVKVIGQTRGAIMLFHDTTLEEQIDKAKSEFVSLASHQLRTPLNVVSWYVEKLLSRKKGDLNESQVDYLQEIATNNRRMIGLVGDILNVSRVELGRIKIKHEVVDLNPLIESLVKEVRPLIEQKQLHFNLQNSLPTDQKLMSSDISMVTVIIQNLLSNAVKYTPAEGSITMGIQTVKAGQELYSKAKLTAANDGVAISVSDSGVGIPAAQQDKIFSKLFRADNVQTMDVSGTGLGLYVTQNFALALGGSVWFESAEGKGTTFYAYLPNVKDKNAEQPAE